MSIVGANINKKKKNKVKDEIFNELEGKINYDVDSDHYKHTMLSPLEAFKKGLLTHEELIGFIKGNVIKYVCRAEHKYGVEDLLKAIEYLNVYIEVLKK